MDEYDVDVLADEALRWARADARREAPQLSIRAYRASRAEDGAVAAQTGEEDLNLVAVEGVLELSPRYGPRDWTLRLRVEGTVEPRPAGDDGADWEDDDALTLDAFESEFVQPDPDNVEATVLAENDAAWRRFQDWLECQRAA